jgi:hypothetical protein
MSRFYKLPWDNLNAFQCISLGFPRGGFYSASTTKHGNTIVLAQPLINQFDSLINYLFQTPDWQTLILFSSISSLSQVNRLPTMSVKSVSIKKIQSLRGRHNPLGVRVLDDTLLSSNQGRSTLHCVKFGFTKVGLMGVTVHT